MFLRHKFKEAEASIYFKSRKALCNINTRQDFHT